MKVWTEKYGADADGNRGIDTLMYELEDTRIEREEITDILIENEYDKESGSVEIEYNGLNIEVYCGDYEDIFDKINADYYKNKIAKIARMPFDDIVQIFNSIGDSYPKEEKSLEEVLYDLENGYTAIPF